MTDIISGMIAGLFAAVLLSMVMLIKRATGLLPNTSLMGMLGRVTMQPRTVDWLIHFLIGMVLYGPALALLTPILPFGYWLDGIVVGLIGWAIASLTLMPAAGKGPFGVYDGRPALIAAVVMHIVFGAMLGLFYDLLVPG